MSTQSRLYAKVAPPVRGDMSKQSRLYAMVAPQFAIVCLCIAAPALTHGTVLDSTRSYLQAPKGKCQDSVLA